MTVALDERQALIERAEAQFLEAIDLKKQFLTGNFIETLVLMAEKVQQAIVRGRKLLLCGNGGSAADAQHLAAELLVRLRSHRNRGAVPAISLALDVSSITACANDFGFDRIYERMVEALGKPGDVLLGLSTSGRSKNVIKALQFAQEKGLVTLGFLCSGGGEMNNHCDLSLIIPSHDPNRVQEVHIAAGHVLMDLIEEMLITRKHLHLVE